MSLSTEATLRSIDNIREGIQIIDFDWHFLYVNAAAARHGRQPIDALLGRRMMECYPGIEATPAYAALKRVMETRTPETLRSHFEYQDGGSAWFELVVDPVPNGVCVLSLDITDSVRLEQQFLQAQKMEAVGQLAGGVAHDFNNLLTGILGYCELLIEDTPESDPRRADLEEIHRAGQQAAALTRQLLAFSRKQLIEPQVIDLNDAITGTARMLRRLIGEDVQLELQLDSSLGHAYIDPGQMNQVLTNLVVNARDAMPHGGRITLETRNIDLDEQYAQTHFEIVPGPYVQISVCDTGVGMSRDVQARLFEPFFTTKAAGQGTGLGLAGVYGIVKQNRGNIGVYSEPGLGTTFHIYLPRVDAAAAPSEPAPHPVPQPAGPYTVLVVEDHPALQALTSRVLRQAGFEVLTADSPASALELARSRDGAIDVLLTDVVMPGHSGPWLAAQMLQDRPDLRVIHMSGYTHDAMVRHGVVDNAVTFIQKPFTPDMLIQKIRQTLA